MVVTLAQSSADRRQTKFPVIDGDIHPTPRSPRALDQYFLTDEWRDFHRNVGGRGFTGTNVPRTYPNAARRDAYPPNGGPAGSDLDFMRIQLLDAWNIEYGILQPLMGAASMRNLEYSAALSSAINEWQIHEWLIPEPRLRSGLVIPYEDGPLSVTEIERRGSYEGFLQLMFAMRTSEPLGRRKYWPIYEAAEALGKPIGIHVGGGGGMPVSGAGWPSYYIEDHTGQSIAFMTQIASFIFEGVFERFPKLKVVLIEGGFAWAPSMAWRMDAAWSKLRAEVPKLQRKPSEYLAEHFWLTTQPMEEPPVPHQFVQLLEQAPWLQDKLMFATDYPHWDFDAPDACLPLTDLPAGFEEALMCGNARKLYNLQPRG
ncbi:MAG: amidohydrolase [Chloroflexi bacterium]|nr:amidohydrolase [Chloroflexota bacterium]